MKFFRKTVSVLSNKYLLTILAFTTWIFFFDRNDVFSQVDRRAEVKKLQQEADYYRNEIANNKSEISELKSNPKELERFAREHYLMKRDGEDIFVVVEDSAK
ncbi:MAG TPA: septum formation initiator family protein [Bacteroidia bacterium]|nr:septum formation initiator family protein [Bacteroidia bacterium]